TQTAEWKQARSFPLDVESLVSDRAADEGRHVVIDRPERVLLALIAVGAGESREVLAFAVKVDGWILFERAPVMRLSAAAVAGFLHEEPVASVWQEAWRSWCRQRQLPSNEVEICSLAYQPPRLEVQPPGRLVQRLQA